MSLKINLIRPDDLLNLKIETTNLKLEKDKTEVLVVKDTKKPAYLTVLFPPQSIEETAYFENSVVPAAEEPHNPVPVQPGLDPNNTDPETERFKQDKDKDRQDWDPLDPPGVKGTRKAVAKAAHPSRLVFKVPNGTKIPYTTQGLLDWSGLELMVNPIAAIGEDPTPDQIANAPPIQEPKETETVLELPYQLLISPTNKVAWEHNKNPFTTNGRTELWHTRMQQITDQGPEELSPTNKAPLRAIYANYPYYNPSQRPPDANAKDPDLGRTAMNVDDRWQIVILTSAFHGYEGTNTLFLQGTPMVMASKETIAKQPEPPSKYIAEKKDISGVSSTLQANFIPGKYSITMQYVPKPFFAEQLMLSSLGGWLKSRGNWNPPKKIPQKTAQINPHFKEILETLRKDLPTYTATNNMSIAANVALASDNIPQMTTMSMQMPTASPQLDLSEWVHVATQGRDHYVRIVYEGELWPFRHKAALIKVTERKFKETAGIIGAYLMQRMYIVVREPEKTFTERRTPFRMVKLTTLVTPDIADPDPIDGTTRSFWVEVTTTKKPREMFQFHAIGKDWSDNLVDFTIPLMFVSISDLPDAAPDKTEQVAIAYNAKNIAALRSAKTFGSKVAFAEQETNPTPNDNTQLVTDTLNFVVDQFGNEAKMLYATVKIPQIQDLLAKDTPTTIRYFQNFVNDGFDKPNGDPNGNAEIKNANDVFAEIISDILPNGFNPLDPFGEGSLDTKTYGLNFTSDRAGGFATPNMDIKMLTRKLGPIAGKIEDALTDKFDPQEFFKGVTAQLFGAFNLMDLLKPLIPTSIGKNGPQLQTKTTDVDGGKKIQALLDWNPKVEEVILDPIIVFRNEGLTGTPSEFTVHAETTKIVTLQDIASPPTFWLYGKLTEFAVEIFEVVKVNFTEFSFDAKDGKKPDVKVKLDPGTPIKFMGDLKFVEELRQAIPPDLFGSGPSLDISPTGIRAGFNFALPPVSVGVFTLKDVSLGASITLPFLDGRPTFDFNISEREKPFLLTVSFFGGTGFFRLQLDTLGMKMLEAALEFGAAASLDIGVASGEVHIMAGIYFSLQRKEDSTIFSAVLTGYMRLGGSLNILGIISLSIEFNLSFTYDSDKDKAWGRATLTVEIEILFFSTSVELTVERAFGGSGDPYFNELFSEPKMWSDYALAFA